jgi:prepilin-type N-terminal cleavage/methylation domain-containing protein
MICRSRRGFTVIELIIVVTIIGICASLAIPMYTQYQAHTRQAEAKAELRSWYNAESSVFAERGGYFEALSESGFSPGRGNRYQYMFATTCTYEIRAGMTATTSTVDSCVTVDQFSFPGSPLTPAGIDGTFAYYGPQSDPGSPAGLGGTCPTCAIRGMAAGNIDHEAVGIDTWVISTKDGLVTTPVCGSSETAAPAGMPFNTFNDANCD